jgi:dynein intermediate chain 1
LLFTDVVILNIENIVSDVSEGAVIAALGCGTCFDFNKQQDHLFLVGTEEGKVHKCSKAYNNQFLDTYDAHHMAVYAVRWNLFHPKIYMTCSADWTVKIWDHTCKYEVDFFKLEKFIKYNFKI